MPSGCAASCRLLAPARCAPRLPRPRPSSASQARAPRCPQEAASPTPRPGPRAGSPRSRETWPLAPAGRFDTPTRRLETLKPGPSCSVAGPVERFNRERGVVVKSAPRADRAMTPERAGSERPGRRVETLAPTERLMRGRGTARVRPSVCACSVARGGGSEGWARSPARATAPGPRGKTKASRSERSEAGPEPAGEEKVTE